jgi:peptidoglycan/LPS O-acetylase OafA/YrhL
VTGTYSYSIYLIHHPLVVGVTESYKRFFPGIENNPGLMFSAALSSWLIIFPLGALTYYLLERPSISFGKRLLRARSRRLIRQSSSGMTSAVDVVF